MKADVERALRIGSSLQQMYLVQLFHRLRLKHWHQAPLFQRPVEGDEVRELSPMLKAVARRMSESKTTVPHFYVTSEIDMTRALALRKELNEALADSGEKVLGERPHRARLLPRRSRCTRRPTAPTSTAGTSTTPTPTSGSPSRSTTA